MVAMFWATQLKIYTSTTKYNNHYENKTILNSNLMLSQSNFGIFHQSLGHSSLVVMSSYSSLVTNFKVEQIETNIKLKTKN